ncbi:MAG: type II toxin-antitoxin system Phd/YefM family antitoxin [Vulcanimicrobiaceae bacterium]
MGVRDAKAHLSELLRDAQQGREWTITERGRPIARIAPLGEPPASNEERLRRLEREGLIEARGAHVRPLPPPLPLGRGLAQRLLDEDRRA